MEEADLCEIHFSAASIEEARTVARYLVQERLVACAQIVPWVESIYLWNGAIETGQESLVLLKTRRSHFERITQILKEHSRYDVPEIILLPIQQASTTYQEWLLEATV